MRVLREISLMVFADGILDGAMFHFTNRVCVTIAVSFSFSLGGEFPLASKKNGI